MCDSYGYNHDNLPENKQKHRWNQPIRFKKMLEASQKMPTKQDRRDLRINQSPRILNSGKKRNSFNTERNLEPG